MHINNHPLVYIHINDNSLPYIHINTHNNYHKKYTWKHPKYFTMISIKIIKNNFFFLVYIKMDKKNIMFFENDDKSDAIIDLYINK